ncbi:MAG: acyl-CoA dehydrogenase family protein [Deltaproteobacteria bacterium]|nr:acyl-CoA dehydrogenase family protein [Deltaproteobacteria bacterium]
MDLRFSEEEEAFRKELVEFLEREVPPEMEADYDGLDLSQEQFEFAGVFDKKLAAKGWLCMHWPKEYGGQAASITRQLIFNEEMGYRRVPSRASMGINIVGPAIMLYGNEEQKKRYLSATARGEAEWCQGFSEPNSGSDLASLRTTAREESDCYVVNGQKIWSSRAHHAHYCWLLARTDPQAAKHKGLTTFAVDMKTPGITVRPIVTILGSTHFCEVFFDDVRVPKDALVGEKNRGWYQAMGTLSFERSGIGRVSSSRRALQDLIAYINQNERYGKPLSQDPIVRQQLAELQTEIEVARLLCYRVAWMQSKAKVPSYESSMARVVGQELSQKVARAGMKILGSSSQLMRGTPGAPVEGNITRAFLSTISNTIRSGTSEIQRNIIAQRGLGLPRR